MYVLVRYQVHASGIYFQSPIFDDGLSAMQAKCKVLFQEVQGTSPLILLIVVQMILTSIVIYYSEIGSALFGSSHLRPFSRPLIY